MTHCHLPLAVLCSLLILGVSASAEGPEKPGATPVPEGVLKVYPKFLYEYYLTTDAGQTCGLTRRLRSRVPVKVRLVLIILYV